jgi:fructose-1,6-bisphosphatase/inositol monophosphatase family enzyme
MTYKKFALNMARQAGKLMRKNFRLGMEKQLKDDGSPVTQTDLAINDLLISQVEKYFPEHSVLAEEKSNLKNSEHVWVCDPIDGTIPFSLGIPVSTFSLALVKNGQPILGVVYDPFLKRLFLAEKNKGARLNNNIIKVSAVKTFARSAAAAENFPRAKYNLSDLLKELQFNKKLIIIQLASIIYPSMLVADGELLFSIFPHTTPHDAAAIKIIVEEAGGKVTDIFGQEQKYNQETNGFIASNGHIHDEVVKLTKELVTLNKISK